MKYTAKIEEDPIQGIIVRMYESSSALPVYSWACKNRRIAERMVRCIESGKAVDAHGQVTIMGRYMSADLRRLGF